MRGAALAALMAASVARTAGALSLGASAARFESITQLTVLAMSDDVVVLDKPRGLRSVPAFGPTAALRAEYETRKAAGEGDLAEKFERLSRRDRWARAAASSPAVPEALRSRAAVGLPRTRTKFLRFATGSAGGFLDDAAAAGAWDAVLAATEALEAADGLEESDSVLKRCKAFTAEARPVHRLDAATAGCLAVALSGKGAAHLSAQWRRRRVSKEYEALVAGSPAADAGDVDLPLLRVRAVRRSGDPSRMVVDADGLASSSSYEVLERSEEAARLRLVPHTGRLHQLRAHCAGIGHPILGDGLYGDEASAPHLCLHATRLSFEDPATGSPLAAVSPSTFAAGAGGF